MHPTPPGPNRSLTTESLTALHHQHQKRRFEPEISPRHASVPIKNEGSNLRQVVTASAGKQPNHASLPRSISSPKSDQKTAPYPPTSATGRRADKEANP